MTALHTKVWSFNLVKEISTVFNFLILNIDPFKYDSHKRLNKVVHLLGAGIASQFQKKILRGFHQINRVLFIKDL